MIKEGELRIAGLSRLGLCVLLSHTLVRGFIFIMVLFGNLGWFFFFFFFGTAGTLLPIQSLWPLLPNLSCLETRGGKQGFNVI